MPKHDSNSVPIPSRDWENLKEVDFSRLNVPRCPNCQRVLIGHIVDAGLVEYAGQQFCDSICVENWVDAQQD